MTRKTIFQRLQLAWRAAFAETTTLPVDADFSPPAEARDRLPYDRQTVLEQALEAWRTNPLARRVVELTSEYVVGGGIRLGSPCPPLSAFLHTWWHHPLNQCPVRVFEWCDELTRSGELFFLLSTDAAGMTYLRPVPAADVLEIETAPNDIQQERSYRLRDGQDPLGGKMVPAWSSATAERNADGSFPAVMVHYAVNRPAGAVRGESDLAPLLRWLSRYSAWLEDRARLNRYRNAFLYVVRARFSSESERSARQMRLQSSPPTPGSILVTDESESWEVLSPKLESDDAAQDGLALKKMIAAGAGLPLHFLAEPESATRTTAEAAGGPTFRRFEQRQEFFLWMTADLARIAVQRRAAVDARLIGTADQIQVSGADLSARDNASLAVAAATIASAGEGLYERGLISAEELLRLVYRFAGEAADVDDLLSAVREAPRSAAGRPQRPTGVGVDPLTGEATGLGALFSHLEIKQ